MLHIKFQGHRSIGSGQDDFKVLFLLYMGMAAMLIMSPISFVLIKYCVSLNFHMIFDLK